MTIGLSHVTLNLLIASVTMLVLVGTTKRFRTKLCHSYYFATVVVVVLKKKTIEVLAIYSEGHAAFPRKLQEKKKKNARNANRKLVVLHFTPAPVPHAESLVQSLYAAWTGGHDRLLLRRFCIASSKDEARKKK